MRGRKWGKGRQPRFDPHDPLLDAAVADALDLHGHTAAEASEMVRGFLAGWQRRGGGVIVRVVTGRGKRSAHGPVLRGVVGRLLDGELHCFVADWDLDYDEGSFLVKLR